MKDLHDNKSIEALDIAQKAKVTVPGILVDEEWLVDPFKLEDLERIVTYDEIKRAIWDCGSNKSSGPDGFTFDFFADIRMTYGVSKLKVLPYGLVSSNLFVEIMALLTVLAAILDVLLG
ncbi:hypothetical protein Tco_0318274 [Tanacetum coccineum]